MSEFPPPVPYQRVLPRDLFNEANLLKCWGQLALIQMNDNRFSIQHKNESESGTETEGFTIVQNPDDGSIEVHNLSMVIENQSYRMFRPLNSRDPWPLWLELNSETNYDILIFDDQGNFSGEFSELLNAIK